MSIFIGICIGICISFFICFIFYKLMKTGYLHITETEDGSFLFLDLDKNIDVFKKNKYVIFKIINDKIEPHE